MIDLGLETNLEFVSVVNWQNVSFPFVNCIFVVPVRISSPATLSCTMYDKLQRQQTFPENKERCSNNTCVCVVSFFCK